VGERLYQFLQLARGAVHFHSCEIGDLDHFREQRTDVLDVREQALGAFVRFAAGNFFAELKRRNVYKVAVGESDVLNWNSLVKSRVLK